MKSKVISKLQTWAKRYLPAEIIGTVTAMASAGLAYALTQNNIIAALGGTWGENIGYYGTMMIRDARESFDRHRQNKQSYSFFSFLLNVRDIIVEFGPAEILDSFFIRPFMMYIFPVITGNLALGIFLGKIAADIIFYIPTIIMYEFRVHLKRAMKKKYINLFHL